ncbi:MULTISPECIES: hypothetical protein [Parachlamydia]|uniref:hypothetical protein n=1 Tax=Parachlamydia TaxID=83551 RepID=UPI0024E1D663|nr:hypothetical protein [Parachlamydia acanthamoebae]
MQCPSECLSRTHSFIHEGINDLYTYIRPTQNSTGEIELKIVIFSSRAFQEMLHIQATRHFTAGHYYGGRCSLQAASMYKHSVPGVKKIQEILTTHYAHLRVKNGFPEALILSPTDAEMVVQYRVIHVVCYRDRKSFEKENEIKLGQIPIYAFAKEEYTRRYIEAAHRIQARGFSYAIFKQTIHPSSFLDKIKKFLEADLGDYTQYKPNERYDIEKGLPSIEIEWKRMLIGYSESVHTKITLDLSLSSEPEAELR